MRFNEIFEFQIHHTYEKTYFSQKLNLRTSNKVIVHEDA